MGYYNIRTGASGCNISIDLIKRQNQVKVGFYIGNNEELYNNLLAKKKEIEGYIDNVKWYNPADKKASRICTYISGLDFENQDNFGELMKSIVSNLVLWKEVFTKYLQGNL